MDISIKNKYNESVDRAYSIYTFFEVKGAELNYYKSFRTAFDRAYEAADYSALSKEFDVNEALKGAIEFETKNSFMGYIED